MCTIYEDKELRKKAYYAFVKGAPEFLIPFCTKFINKKGDISRINSTFLNQINSATLEFARKSLRTILVAYKLVDEIPNWSDEIESDLIIIGLVGIEDPLKEGINEAVYDCNMAGVKVRMVTGESKDAAVAIAKEIGILPISWNSEDNDYRVMEGKQFRECIHLIYDEER